MQLSSNFKHPQNLSFIIEEDKNVGFYLYIYDSRGFNTHDYLQDSLEIAKEQALDDFGVPLDSWVQVE